MASKRKHTQPKPSPPSSNSIKHSLATSLPVEIIDLIFAHHFNGDRELWQKQGLDAVALVCRAWRLPAQRIWLAEIDIRTPALLASFTALLKGNPALGAFVRNFVLGYAPSSNDPRWSVGQLVKVLRMLPTLRTLYIVLNTKSPGYAADFSSFSKLKNLATVKDLKVQSRYYDPDFRVLRKILVATPNITSLSLADEEIDGDLDQGLPPLTRTTPIDLPQLVHLFLDSEKLCRDLKHWNLFSPSTLEQVTHLGLHSEPNQKPNLDDSDAPPLVWGSSLGPKVTNLDLGIDFEPESAARTIKACPTLEVLTVASRFVQLDPPPTLHTLLFRPDPYATRAYYGDATWLAKEGDLSPVVSWGNIKTIEMRRVSPYLAVSSFLKRKIHLTVNGIVRSSPAIWEGVENAQSGSPGESDYDSDEEYGSFAFGVGGGFVFNFF